jgi:serine phosphatase RsbU (regulator of sigma subunit)
MIEEAEFSVLQFRFTEGDHLLLMSDGIAEATAAAIATAAQNFGQEDDISVISITRTVA